MGLDMYAFSAKSLEDEEPLKIAYWRKHNALHNWMEQVWKKKHPQKEDDFNCVKLHLTSEDLLQLKKDIKQCNLKATSGFFFGNTDYMNEYKNSDQQEEDLEFINKALSEIDNGSVIYYDSWW